MNKIVAPCNAQVADLQGLTDLGQKIDSGRPRKNGRCPLRLSDRLLELNCRENTRSLNTNGKESRRIETQGFQDGGGHLYGSHSLADGAGLEAGMRE